MPIFRTYQIAFGRGEIRAVVVPEDRVSDDREATLEAIYHFGQNDFQRVADRYSLSVGDVVELDDETFYRIAGIGFQSIEKKLAMRLIAAAATGGRRR